MLVMWAGLCSERKLDKASLIDSKSTLGIYQNCCQEIDGVIPMMPDNQMMLWSCDLRVVLILFVSIIMIY